ncbi:hypothetical protein ZIOFF_013542 [Zingiber officinale]|uniref:Uncharacterized protein n=1 Tax=Zingiber officinale TaxID=94328 RepID=A0A8J5HFY9_ZINOF|nr:hypothetical protein ZIOFF_013542 [Zingiber officinale]
MPSRMCINPTHNKKGILYQSGNPNTDGMYNYSTPVTLFDKNSYPDYALCACLYIFALISDLDLISSKIPVISDNSKAWSHILSTNSKLRRKGVIHVNGVSRSDLNENNHYSNVLLINRTASPLAWSMECKDRTNHSSVLLPHDFLPMMAVKRLRNVTDKVVVLQMCYLTCKIANNYLIIQCKLCNRYELACSSNFTIIFDSVVENNYHLFIVERLILASAETYVKTYKEDEDDLSLINDPKNNNKNCQIPVYTMDNEGIDR